MSKTLADICVDLAVDAVKRLQEQALAQAIAQAKAQQVAPPPPPPPQDDIAEIYSLAEVVPEDGAIFRNAWIEGPLDQALLDRKIKIGFGTSEEDFDI